MTTWLNDGSPLVRPSPEEIGRALLEATAATERLERLLARAAGCVCEPTFSVRSGAWPLEYRLAHALCPLAGQASQ